MHKVWFSSLLKTKLPEKFEEIEKVLSGRAISVKLLEGTRDIWCRDYLPVYDGAGEYVQFLFDPRYLKPKKYIHLRTDPRLLHQQLGVKPCSSDLILDGGNIVRYARTAIITDIVFKDNSGWSEGKIREEIYSKLNISNLIIIPKQPNDFTGHADGMVRLLDEKNVLVNDYSREKKYFRDRLLKTLKNGGLNYHTFPYAADYSSKATISAVGTYINFLKIEKLISFPSFGLPEDKEAEKEIERFFPGCEVCIINSRLLAEEGGVLNCVGWVR